MKLIVGLGNPGKDYNNTRHNIGFNFVDYYLESKNIHDKWTKKFDGEYIETNIDGEKVLFFKPLTYMNLSGIAVGKIMRYFHIDVEDLLIICDDLDINTGNFKLKSSGSCAGHNGLRNIEENIGTDDYKRLKIGISKNEDIDTKDYVLGSLSTTEKKIYDELFHELCFVIDDYFSLPFGDLMSKYNRKNR